MSSSGSDRLSPPSHTGLGDPLSDEVLAEWERDLAAMDPDRLMNFGDPSLIFDLPLQLSPSLPAGEILRDPPAASPIPLDLANTPATTALLGLSPSDVESIIYHGVSQSLVPLSGLQSTSTRSPLALLSVTSQPPSQIQGRILVLEFMFLFFKEQVAKILMLEAARAGLTMFLSSGMFPNSAETILGAAWNSISHSHVMPGFIFEELSSPVCSHFCLMFIVF